MVGGVRWTPCPRAGEGIAPSPPAGVEPEREEVRINLLCLASLIWTSALELRFTPSAPRVSGLGLNKPLAPLQFQLATHRSHGFAAPTISS